MRPTGRTAVATPPRPGRAVTTQPAGQGAVRLTRTLPGSIVINRPTEQGVERSTASVPPRQGPWQHDATIPPRGITDKVRPHTPSASLPQSLPSDLKARLGKTPARPGKDSPYDITSSPWETPGAAQLKEWPYDNSQDSSGSEPINFFTETSPPSTNQRSDVSSNRIGYGSSRNSLGGPSKLGESLHVCKMKLMESEFDSNWEEAPSVASFKVYEFCVCNCR